MIYDESWDTNWGVLLRVKDKHSTQQPGTTAMWRARTEIPKRVLLIQTGIGRKKYRSNVHVAKRKKPLCEPGLKT